MSQISIAQGLAASRICGGRRRRVSPTAALAMSICRDMRSGGLISHHLAALFQHETRVLLRPVRWKTAGFALRHLDQGEALAAGDEQSVVAGAVQLEGAPEARALQAFKAAFDDLKPDFVVIVMYKAPSGADPTVISLSSLEHIKQAGVPIIAIWGDVESLEQQWLARSLEPWITKNISTASKEIAENMGYKYMHVPKNPKVFYSDDRVRDLDVVFSGSFGAGREDRQRAIKYLLDNGVKIIYGGSECGDHFPVMEYADRYRQAKIALSFSTACGKNVVNARSFEVMTCGAMLLEKEGDELKKLYTPNVDYVPWTDEVDLLNKVRYYLEHEDERKKIADSGHKKTIELYSAKTFWDSALKGIIK